jgi:hypothetical protein
MQWSAMECTMIHGLHVITLQLHYMGSCQGWECMAMTCLWAAQSQISSELGLGMMKYDEVTIVTQLLLNLNPLWPFVARWWGTIAIGAS